VVVVVLVDMPVRVAKAVMDLPVLASVVPVEQEVVDQLM
jgi:hypothetical protein